MKKTGLISLMLLLFSCSAPKQESDSGLREVRIQEAILNDEVFQLSDITEGDIEYIPLETKKEYLLDKDSRFYLNDTYIIAFTQRQIYLFDRKSGEYVKEIGHFGNDPGGYQKTVYSYPYDVTQNLFYTNGWENQSYYRYNASGQLEDEITVYSESFEPDLQNSEFGEMVTSIAPLNDSCFVGHVWNINGKQKTKLIIFNENNRRIKTYPQHKTFEWDIYKDGLNVFHWDGWFYEFNKGLNYYERSSDTIFNVSIEHLKPVYTLDGPTYLDRISESKRFLLFSLRKKEDDYYGIFDKKNEETKVSTTDGIVNDIDGFIPFQFYSVNNDTELIGSREAFEIKHWFDQNPEKISQLPEQLQKLKNINENDNPVVMIAKLKE